MVTGVSISKLDGSSKSLRCRAQRDLLVIRSLDRETSSFLVVNNYLCYFFVDYEQRSIR
jgi:hypothetical protein